MVVYNRLANYYLEEWAEAFECFILDNMHVIVFYVAACMGHTKQNKRKGDETITFYEKKKKTNYEMS